MSKNQDVGVAAPPEPEVIIGSREQLLHLLAEAAEIEHTLMCSYLYAAFSLKRSEDGAFTEPQATAIARWREVIMSVAIEEMGHLLIVANLMLAVGASGKGKLAEAIRYALNRWDGLCRLLDDGRVEIDSNTVERSIRPLALNRKNALFAGSDQGGEHWAVIASLIETCKLNRVSPQAWLSTALTSLADGHPASALGRLMPWTSAPDVA